MHRHISESGSPGGAVIATAHHLNTPTGQQTQDVSVSYASAPLEAGKTVRYLTLPDISRGVAQGRIAMHVFAITTG